MADPTNVDIRFSNNAFATLDAPLSMSGTTFVVPTGQGIKFPPLSTDNDYFYAVLIDVGNNNEVVKVTNRITDTFTIVRGQEGTTPRAYVAGSKVSHRVTAASLVELAHLTAAEHGTVHAGALATETASREAADVALRAAIPDTLVDHDGRAYYWKRRSDGTQYFVSVDVAGSYVGKYEVVAGTEAASWAGRTTLAYT